MNPSNRPQTINSRGEIVDRPYGVSRWSSPKAYACVHPECTNPATVLKAANSHPDVEGAPANAHNCCATH